MRDSRTIWYRGARYELGRGLGGYGIWPAASPAAPAVELWPETPQGWSAAWSRYTAVEEPGSIAHLSAPTARVARTDGATAAAALIALGVACGIAGLFPAYLSGSALAQQTDQLVPHVIYLAVWTASAVLILRGGLARRAGTLLGLGTSSVTFGFLFADLSIVIASSTQSLRAGLLLSLVSWLACTAGLTLAFRLPAPDGPRWPHARAAGAWLPLAAAAAAALGTAITFAPSWDRFTLHNAAGVAQSVTAGNSFTNPGPVIAGDVAVMVALVAVVVAAALWRPARPGAALLAGAAIPMAAQAVSALIQISQPVSPALFGLAPAQAAQAGLSVTAGLTTVFWVYCGFLVALVAAGAWLAWAPRSRQDGHRAAAPQPSAPQPAVQP